MRKLKIAKIFNISIIIFFTSFQFNSNTAYAFFLPEVYDSCNSPHPALNIRTSNWIYGIGDKNTPSRISPVTYLYPVNYPRNYSQLGCLYKLHKLFSDDEGFTQRLIFVDMYSFRSYPLAKELVEAKRKNPEGVEIIVSIDERQNLDQEDYRNQNFPGEDTIRDYLESGGIHVFVQNGRSGGVSHNKTISIIEYNPQIGVWKTIYVTGSYNFTDNAETTNRENLVFIRNAVPLVLQSIREILVVGNNNMNIMQFYYNYFQAYFQKNSQGFNLNPFAKVVLDILNPNVDNIESGDCTGNNNTETICTIKPSSHETWYNDISKLLNSGESPIHNYRFDNT